MCGFIGYISNAREEKGLARSLPWLARRGPDSWQLWMSSDRCVSLLHTRLAVVDKDPRANQPYVDPDRALTLAFTGEIYNYPQLKSKFIHYNFRTVSDTEVILAAYATCGIDGLSLLKGMFSIVIVDERQRKIILARDSIGKKPLFLAHWPEGALFGSSVLALAAVNKELGEINDQALAYFWENSFVPPHTTVLSGVTPVLPGQVLELDWQGNLIGQKHLEPERTYLYNSEPLGKVQETVDSLLTIALRRRLANNPRPVVLLSGGIDSTLVCKVAHQICSSAQPPVKLQAITLRSFIPMMNDEFYARFAAGRMKIPLELVRPDMHRLGDLIIKAIDLQDEPLGMPSFFLLERLVQAASAYGKVLLTGDGGDEVFLGYGKAADWSRLNPDEIKQDYLSCGPALPQEMSEWARKTVSEVLIGHMFTKLDRAASEQGVEIRCPLLDWDLVSYARSLPFEVLLRGGRTKALLKDSFMGWPRWFLERPKLGFAYNLRWHWGASNYSGLREAIDRRTIDTFAPFVPEVLRQSSSGWKMKDIFLNFEAAWRLLTWARFLARLDRTRCSG